MVSDLSTLVTPLAWKAHKDSFLEFGDRAKSDRWLSRLRPNERAQFLHRQILEEMMSLLESHGRGINHKWLNVKNMELLTIEDVAVIGFKRFNGDLSRSNYETVHNVEYWSQSGRETPLKLIIGYYPHASWNDANVYLTLPAARPRRGALEWVPVADQTERLIHITSTTPIEKLPAASKEPTFRVRPKTKDAGEKKADSDAG